MIANVLTVNGELISAEKAVEKRTKAQLNGDPTPIYIDPESGETVLRVRKGANTALVKRKDHFYHPRESHDSGAAVLFSL